MADLAERVEGEVVRTAELLGGRRVLRRDLTSPLDAHDLLQQGLPAASLEHLRGRLHVLTIHSGVDKALGISERTYHRRKGSPDRTLSREQSGRAWKFAEILGRATSVFGSQEEAERWLEAPAMALEQRRPLDLLSTPAGVEMVEDHLTRLEYGVYT